MFFLVLLLLPLSSLPSPTFTYPLSLTYSSNQYYLGFSYKMTPYDNFNSFPLEIDLLSTSSYFIKKNGTGPSSLFQKSLKGRSGWEEGGRQEKKGGGKEKEGKTSDNIEKQNKRILRERSKEHLDSQKTIVNFAEIAFDDDLIFRSASFLVRSSSPLPLSSPSNPSSSSSYSQTSSPFLPTTYSGYFGLNLLSPDSETFTIATMIHEMKKKGLIFNRSFSLDLWPQQGYLVLGGYNSSILGSRKKEVRVREEGGNLLEFGLSKTTIYFCHNEIFKTTINIEIRVKLSLKEKRILLPRFHLEKLNNIFQSIYKSCSIVSQKEKEQIGGVSGELGGEVGEEGEGGLGRGVGGAAKGVGGMIGGVEEGGGIEEDEGENGRLYCVDHFGFMSTKYPLLFFEKKGVKLKVHADDYLEKCERLGNGLMGCWLKIGASRKNNTVVLGLPFLQANSLLVEEGGGIAFRYKDFNIDEYFIDHDWYYTFYALLVVWGISMLACGLYFRTYMERLNRLTHKITLIFYHKCRDRINGRNGNNDDLEDSEDEDEEEERAAQNNNNINNNNQHPHQNNLNNGQNNNENNLNGMNSNPNGLNGQNNQNLGQNNDNFGNRE